jgi:small subunit ribosomal protein S6
MRTYEVLFILSPQAPEEEIQSLISEFRGVAERSGAKLTREDAWGRRRLAYPIEKAHEGIYHLFVFESDGQSLSELDRRMRNSDRVLRHLISRTDEDLKRAAKLAKRNPKKERRPPQPEAVPSAASSPASPNVPPAAAPEQAAGIESPVLPTE